MPNFADDWITTGWSHGPDGKWIELGHSAAVKSYPPAELPELPIHAVTDWLNAREDLYAALQLYVDHFGDPLKVARPALAKARGEKP